MTEAEQKAFRKKLTVAVLIEAAIVMLGAFLVLLTGNTMLIIPTLLVAVLPVVKVAIDKQRAYKRSRTVE